MFDPRHVWAAILTDFSTSNETVLYSKEASSGEAKFLYGLQAQLLHEHRIDVIEDVGHPDEVFVTAPKLAKLLDCAPETARKWLKRFQAHGLLEQHGDIDINGRAEYLYLPALKDAEDVFTVLDDFAGGSSKNAPTHLTEVTPSDFELTDSKGVYHYREDSEITIDVRGNEGTQSIQEYIEEQLEEVGLTPSSPHNFSYQLRERAGLVGSSTARRVQGGSGGNPEPFQSTTCFIELSDEESPIKAKNQAEAMTRFVEYLIHEQDFLETHTLPWVPGRGYRAIINNEPCHTNGEPMEENHYQRARGGYYVFTHLKAADKQRYMQMLAEEAGQEVDFSGGW